MLQFTETCFTLKNIRLPSPDNQHILRIERELFKILEIYRSSYVFAFPFSLTPRVDYDLMIQSGNSGTIQESNQASGVH